MGTARYMVTIRFPGEKYPSVNFFDDVKLANMFYYDRRESYSAGSLFEGTEVNLWRLSDDGQQWSLKLSSNNA